MYNRQDDVPDDDTAHAHNGAGGAGGPSGVADETIATILESMDIGALSEKHNLAVKQSLLLAFLYLAAAAAVALAAAVLALAEVRGITFS